LVSTTLVTADQLDPRLDFVSFRATGLTRPRLLDFLKMIPLLLWFAFVNHTSLERPFRRIFQQVAAISLVVVIGMVLVAVVLASFENVN
jgi:hypothetical protein